MEEDRMGGAEIGEMRNTHRISIGRPERNIALCIIRCI
jgi:hypothetical protein